jgi:hypothetical protein
MNFSRTTFHKTNTQTYTSRSVHTIHTQKHNGRRPSGISTPMRPHTPQFPKLPQAHTHTYTHTYTHRKDRHHKLYDRGIYFLMQQASQPDPDSQNTCQIPTIKESEQLSAVPASRDSDSDSGHSNQSHSVNTHVASMYKEVISCIHGNRTGHLHAEARTSALKRLRELEASAPANMTGFTSEHLSILLRAHAVCHFPLRPDLFKAVKHHTAWLCIKHCAPQRFTAAEIAECFWSFGTLHQHPGEYIFHVMWMRAQEVLHDMSAGSLAKMMLGCARLASDELPSHTRHTHTTMFPELFHRSREQLQDLTCHDVSNILGACAWSNTRPPPAVLDQLCRRVNELPAAELHAEDVAHFLWAYAKLEKSVHTHSDSVSPVVDRMFAHISNLVEELSAQDVADVLWAAVTLSKHDHSLVQKLCRRAYETVAEDLTSAKPQNSAIACSILWSLAKSSHHPDKKLVEALSAKAVQNTSGISTVGISNILWSFAKLAHNPGHDAMERLCQRTHMLVETLSAQGVSITLHSLAKLGHYPEAGLFRALTKRCMAVLHEFTAQGIGLVLYACAEFGERYSCSCVCLLSGFTVMTVLCNGSLCACHWAAHTQRYSRTHT